MLSRRRHSLLWLGSLVALMAVRQLHSGEGSAQQPPIPLKLHAVLLQCTEKEATILVSCENVSEKALVVYPSDVGSSADISWTSESKNTTAGGGLGVFSTADVHDRTVELAPGDLIGRILKYEFGKPLTRAQFEDPRATLWVSANIRFERNNDKKTMKVALHSNLIGLKVKEK